MERCKGQLGLAAGLLVSLVVHGAAFLALGWAAERQDGVPAGAEPIPLPDPPREERERLALGIQESRAASITWIGFETPTEHSAERRETDQPALAMIPAPMTPAPRPDPPPNLPEESAPSPPPAPPSPPGPAAVTAPPDQLSRSSPEGATPPEVTRPSPAPAFTELEPGPATPPTPLHVLSPAGEPRLPPPDRPLRSSPLPSRASERDHPADEVAAQPERQVDAEAVRAVAAPARDPANPARSSPQDSPAVRGGQEVETEAPPAPRDAEQADKESDAASRVPTHEVIPGRPLAAQGLEIQTRRPRFTLLTQMMAKPVKLVLDVTFDRRGAVSKAVYVEPSGAPEIDEPVKSSVYQWRAKGRALQELPVNDPAAGVTIRIVYRLQ